MWFQKIGEQLQDTAVGIICLTGDNKNKPWILFEAGALAKGLSSSLVCTLLIDLKPEDIEDPLAQFNHTMPDKNGIQTLIGTLNSSLGNPLDASVLERVFDTYWPQFEARFAEILKMTPPNEPSVPRDDRDMLAEILSISRSLSSRVARLEETKPEIKPIYSRLGIGHLDEQTPTVSIRDLAKKKNQTLAERLMGEISEEGVAETVSKGKY